MGERLRGGLLAVGLVLAGACSGGGDGGDAEPADAGRTLALGEAAEVAAGRATVLAVEEDVAVAADVFAATDDAAYLGAEVEVCGDAEVAAEPFTFRARGGETEPVEPVPLPAAAFDANHPPLDQAGEPDEDDCRSGWVLWSVAGEPEGRIRWTGEAAASWAVTQD